MTEQEKHRPSVNERDEEQAERRLLRCLSDRTDVPQVLAAGGDAARISEMFVRVLGHDLRNSLNAISTAATGVQWRRDPSRCRFHVELVALASSWMRPTSLRKASISAHSRLRCEPPMADRILVGKTINTLGFGPAKVAAFPSCASAGGLEALRQLHAHLHLRRGQSVRLTYVRVRPYAPYFDNRLSPAPAIPRNRRLPSRCPETPHRPLQGQGSLYA